MHIEDEAADLAADEVASDVDSEMKPREVRAEEEATIEVAGADRRATTRRPLRTCVGCRRG